MGKLSQWYQQEDTIILQEFSLHKSRKWKHISKKLFQNGFVKTEAECRQRYVNHLDPRLSKEKQISEEELQIIYEKYQEYGPKWCLIQTFIPERTQIRIKNIFYGNIRLFLKKLYKYFSKKTAVFINDLKTQDLQAIYQGIQQFQGLNMTRKDFKRVAYKVNTQTSFLIIKQSPKKYLELLNRIITFKTKLRTIPDKEKKLFQSINNVNKEFLGKIEQLQKNQIKILQNQWQKKSKNSDKNEYIQELMPQKKNETQGQSCPFSQFSQTPLIHKNGLLNLVPYVNYRSFNYPSNQSSFYCLETFQNPLIFQNSSNSFFYTLQAPFSFSNNMSIFSNDQCENQQNLQFIGYKQGDDKILGQ